MSGRSSYALRAAPDRPLEHAVEVRHPSFEQHEAAWVSLLERHHVASVAADTAGRYPRIDRTTADFAYARLHGDRELYVSGYDDAGSTGGRRGCAVTSPPAAPRTCTSTTT